jgi:hypothetical protein
MQIVIYKRRTGEIALQKCFVTELVCASDDILIVQSPQRLEGGIEDAYFVDIGGDGSYTSVKFDHNVEKNPPYTLVGRIVGNQSTSRYMV